MSYTEHLRGFYLRRQFKSISYNALLLYYILTEQFNSQGFPRTMPIPISKLSQESGMTRRQVLKARRDLINKGYLQIVPVPKSAGTAFELPSLSGGYSTSDKYYNSILIFKPFAEPKLLPAKETEKNEKS